MGKIIGLIPQPKAKEQETKPAPKPVEKPVRKPKKVEK